MKLFPFFYPILTQGGRVTSNALLDDKYLPGEVVMVMLRGNDVRHKQQKQQQRQYIHYFHTSEHHGRIHDHARLERGG